jgi:ABC-type dipeptide/oligopeptide/nickel transport system permease component
MLNYAIRRIGYGLLILLGVNLLTFFLFFTVNTPDDMARLNIGGKRVTQEQIEKWKSKRLRQAEVLERQGDRRRARHQHDLLGTLGGAVHARLRPLGRAAGRQHRP